MNLEDFDLSEMSRTEKLTLFSMLEEKERRLRDSRAVYEPNEGQVLVHSSDKPVRLVFSGNGSGKTALGTNEAMWAAQGFNPVLKTFTAVPSRVVVVLSHPDKVEQNWLPEIRKWFNLREDQQHKRGKPYISELTLDNGSSLGFMFHEQSEQAFESIEVDTVVFDEPPPRHVWIGLRRGGRKKDRKPRYLFIGTPISEPWMYSEFYEPWERGEMPNVECFQYDTSVNEKNLADGYKEDFGQFLTDGEKKIRFGGEFFHLSGLPLKSLFNRKTHTISRAKFEDLWDDSNPCVVAIDPHPSKKHVSCLLGCDRDGQLYYIKEYASREVPRVYAKSLKEWYKGYKVIDIVCDSLGNTELTGGEGNLSFIQVLRDEGVPLRSTTYQDKDEESWIMRIQDVLTMPEEPDNFGRKIPTLLVVDDNLGVIKNIETVSWVKIKNEELFKKSLDIKNKDYLATLKYALATNLNYNKRLKAPMYRRTRPATTYGQQPRTPAQKTMLRMTKRLPRARGYRGYKR